jgi:chaperonin GroES
MTLRPLHDNLVIVPKLTPNEENGIILPEDRDESLQVEETGIVVAVGPGRKNKKGARIPTEIPRGSEVVYGKHHHLEYEIDGQKYKIVPEREVYGVLHAPSQESL